MLFARGTFLTGVNLPWITYGADFGANAWFPAGGVGAAERAAALEEICSRLADRGLRHVRWFMFCDGRAGLTFDERGVPAGLDAFVFRDVDAALAAAARHGLSLIPVLFDFTWCARRRLVNGVQLGGRRRVLLRGDERSRLLEWAVQPVLERYGREPVIAVWDLFNEPEWAALGYGSLDPRTSIWPWTMRALLEDLARLVHSQTRQGATVGLALRRGLRLVRSASLDLYQLHWYDRRSRFLPVVSGGWDGKPVLLGEFPTKGSARKPLEIVEAARERGYCGAFGWSALAADDYSHLGLLEDAIRSFNA